MSLEDKFEFKKREFEKMLESLHSIKETIYYVDMVHYDCVEVTIVVEPENKERYGITKALLLRRIEADPWKYEVFVVDLSYDRRICILDTIYEIMYTFVY